MQLYIKGVLFNMFKSKDFLDKKTGQTTPGKWKLQFMIKKQLADTVQNVLQDISIPDSMFPKFKDQINKTITIPVGTMVKNNRVIYYGLDEFAND